jgi:hypothetical protein
MKNVTVGQVLDGFIDWAVFIGASGICMLRSMELFSRYSPETVFGFADVKIWYGVLSALLVEGLLVVIKVSMSHTKTAWNWLFNLGLIVMLWAMSAGAQVLDPIINKGQFDTLPGPVQGLVTIGIPLIPSLILAAVMARGLIRTIPDELTEQAAKTRAGQFFEGRSAPAFQQVIEPAAAELHRSEDGPAGDAPFSGGEAGDEPDAEVSA